MAAVEEAAAADAEDARKNGGNGQHHEDHDDDFVLVHAPPAEADASSHEQQARRHQQPPSLFRDPNVPPLVRWGIPILLLANDALLLYSNLGDGATVHVRIFDGDQPDGQGRSVESAPLYTITLGRSIKDMWNAKAYFTSLLIAVFAGAWPHIKSLTSFLCWVLDGRRLGRDARRVLLTLAYVLQKLSHVETFVLVILMTGGSLKAHLPEHDDWGVRSVIRPQTGFYCFLTGLCCSMFLSRVALHYDYLATAAFEEAEEEEQQQRQEQEEAEYAATATALLGGDDDDGDGEEEDGDGGGEKDNGAFSNKRPRSRPRSSSCRSSFSSGSSSGRHCVAAAMRVVDTVGVPSGSAWQDVATPYLLLGLLAFFVVGLVTPCFQFAYQGLAGWILSHVTEAWPDVSPPVKTSTVVSLGLGVPAATDDPDTFGVRYLQAAFLFFVVAAPLGGLVLLLALTLVPVRMGGKLLMAAEVLYAWSAPDVLFVSMVTTTLEIRNFVHFVLGDRCEGLNAVLRAVFDKELDGDDVCFDMVAEMESGIWIYGTASLVFFAVGAVILRNVQREYAPYLKQERRRQRQRREGGGDNRGRSSSSSSSSLFFFWRRRGSASTRAATMPLLVDEEEEEGKMTDGLPPPVTIVVSPRQ